ncbi:type II toxin-antitoxin system RelE/ParE family toxin [Chelatococcus sambhunathii]|uniref:Type II toxin-antitoxin system RelE/ParE family toxin n=1 Tax=Chelatococcus sambhunathii TaxID=363953 RepID=A0ABU1DJY2_9HYPH|nr:type II toxin-antitoxin system RelE/ParE family toxin [Chelatococcus sambhunathii]MDR4308320.1 type II toxin-antitoxin system RelE/ParE family toxin [Chelatococcus sambhunathii]
MKVRLSDDARNFLREEARYLRRHSPIAAKRLLSRISEARTNLSRFPQIGAQSDWSSVPRTRRLVLDEYVLLYEVDDEGVAITSIRHGRMRPEIPDLEDDFDYEAGDEEG